MTDRPDYDAEIAEVSKELSDLREQFDRASRDYDDYRTLQLRSAIAACDRRLDNLYRRKEAQTGSLSSGAIFFSSDH